MSNGSVSPHSIGGRTMMRFFTLESIRAQSFSLEFSFDFCRFPLSCADSRPDTKCPFPDEPRSATLFLSVRLYRFDDCDPDSESLEKRSLPSCSSTAQWDFSTPRKSLVFLPETRYLFSPEDYLRAVTSADAVHDGAADRVDGGNPAASRVWKGDMKPAPDGHGAVFVRI